MCLFGCKFVCHCECLSVCHSQLLFGFFYTSGSFSSWPFPVGKVCDCLSLCLSVIVKLLERYVIVWLCVCLAVSLGVIVNVCLSVILSGYLAFVIRVVPFSGWPFPLGQFV